MSDQFSPIIKIIWISRNDMTPFHLEKLAEYCERTFNNSAFSVNKYTEYIDENNLSTVSFDAYDIICIDGTPRYLENIKRYVGDKPVLCSIRNAEKTSSPSAWINFSLLTDNLQNRETTFGNIMKSWRFLLASTSIMFLLMIPLGLYSRYSERVSIIEKNLEHKLNEEVSVEDLTHLENDIYLARCFTSHNQFNAYLYYDTSTVRIDEGSILDTPIR